MWPLVLSVFGCGRGIDTLPGVDVQRAWLEGVEMATVAVVAGPVNGRGNLVIETPDGELRAYAVELHGGVVGGVLELGVAGPFRVDRVELDLPERPLPASALLGRYRGWSAGVSALAGVDHHHLRNAADVRIDATRLQLGVSANLAHEWFHVGLRRPEPIVWGTEVDTADTGAAEPPDTADTGAPAASRTGCGCRRAVDLTTGDTAAALLGLLAAAAARRRRST